MDIEIPPGVVGIDTVEVRIPYVGPRLNTGYKQIISPDGEVSARSSYRIGFAGRDNAHKLHLAHDESHEQLILEGSPNGYVFGQNIFSGTSLPSALSRAWKQITNGLNESIKLPQKIPSDAELDRVDIAVNFRFEDDEEVANLLDQLAIQFASQRRSMFRQSNSVYWNPKLGKEYLFAFYAKGIQMRKRISRQKQSSSFFNKMVDETKGFLRVELRLRKSELQKNNLLKVSDWKSTTPRKIFCAYFKKLPILNSTSGPITPDEIRNMKRSLARVLAIHKSNAPINFLFDKKTISRHRSTFKNMGLDIRCPNMPDKSILLGNVLSEFGRIVRTPDWMIHEQRAPALRRNLIKKEYLRKKNTNFDELRAARKSAARRFLA